MVLSAMALNFTSYNLLYKMARVESDKLKVSFMPTFIKLRG